MPNNCALPLRLAVHRSHVCMYMLYAHGMSAVPPLVRGWLLAGRSVVDPPL